MASRQVKDLLPALQVKFAAFAARMAEEELPFILTCTFRSQEEQDILYEQGRTRPGKVVTWTRKSKHTERRAFDIVICKDGVPNWNYKADVNEDQIPDYRQAGEIGERIGLRWGGHFNDYCHFEL